MSTTVAAKTSLVEGSKNGRGRPRLETAGHAVQLGDVRHVLAYGATRRVTALALDEFWRQLGEPGSFVRLRVPSEFREKALVRLGDYPVDRCGEPAPDPVEWARAVLDLLEPERRTTDPGQLDLHDDLAVAVRRLRRLERRVREIDAAQIAAFDSGG